MKIDNQLIDKVMGEAMQSPRLRMNYNFHEGPDSKAQRLLNVMMPGTIVPIHRHRNTSETYIVLKGKLFVVFYNETGAQSERYLLDAEAGNYGVQIPKGQWHSVEVFEPATIFEVKDGPYEPLQPEDMMD